VLNSVRHARASEIRLSLWRSQSGYRASLTAHGVRFVVAGHEGGNHYGLKGMKQRVQKLGGTLAIDSAPGTGTRIEIAIPLPIPSTH